jgi:NAD(P)-dependent dehydrogenase (short-subunit alcohol dehydrogenase family)
VNNAGVAYGNGVLDTKPEEIDHMFDINTKGTIYTVQATVPHMPHGGRIINVSSSSARRGQVTVPVYGSTKAAIDAITWSLAKEVRLSVSPYHSLLVTKFLSYA